MHRLLALAIVMIGCLAPYTEAGYFGAALVETDAEFTRGGDRFETDDGGTKYFAGRRLFRMLGIEASYRDLGTHRQTVGEASIDVELEAIDISATGTLLFSRRTELLAKLGYGRIETGGSLAGVSIDDEEWALIYGAGFNVTLSRSLSLRAEWERYDIEPTVRSFSVGALFRF